MLLDDEIDGPRIARYVMGRCSPDEASQIRGRLAYDAALAELVEELERLWQATVPTTSGWDVERAWADLLAARALHHAAPEHTPAPLRQPPDLYLTFRARPAWTWRAAAAAILVGTGTLSWYAIRASRSTTPPAPLTEITTRPGQRAVLRLADGTRVELGVASRIRYAPTYGTETRTVHLEGEAYFDVTHDERRPFAVHTAYGVARGLGTQFSVRAYPETEDVEVVVVEGAVSLEAALPARPPERVVLGASDLGRVNPAGQMSVERGVDTAARLAWREGRLVFHDTPFGEALAQLSRWYDADLRLGDSALANYPLTATLRGESLTSVLRLLAAALDVRVEREGAAMVFYPKTGTQ